jgi:hypothetical protein
MNQLLPAKVPNLRDAADEHGRGIGAHNPDARANLSEAEP